MKRDKGSVTAPGTSAKTAGDVMVRPVRTIKASASLVEAHTMMTDMGIHHLLAIDDFGKLVGVLSDRDIKKFASPFAGSKLEEDRDRATLKLPVQSIMSKKVLSCPPDMPIKQCIELMLQKSIHAIPVVDGEGKLTGLVTATDMLRIFLGCL